MTLSKKMLIPPTRAWRMISSSVIIQPSVSGDNICVQQVKKHRRERFAVRFKRKATGTKTRNAQRKAEVVDEALSARAALFLKGGATE